MLDNLSIQKKNQNDLRDLEQKYVMQKIEDVSKNVELKKEKITKDLIKFAETHKTVNPLVITNYFFKSIVPITSQIPEYNAEKLGIVYDYYCYIIAEINDKVGYFPSSLASFCKLAGITSGTLRSYRNSSDLCMRNVVDKIYDEIGDANLTMSQLDIVKERSTIFKLKTQNEVIETVQPKVNINIVEQPDMEAINDKIAKYKIFAEKKSDK